MRIRHYGFLANRCRKEKLAKIRQWLGQVVAKEAADESESAEVKHTLPQMSSRTDAGADGLVANEAHRWMTYEPLR